MAKRPVSRFRFVAGKISDVKIVDPHTVDLITKDPWPFCQMPFIPPCQSSPRSTARAKPTITLPSTPWARAATYSRNGYEKAMSCSKQTKTTGTGPPIPKVVINPITNDATRIAGLVTGQTDLCVDVPLQYRGPATKRRTKSRW